MKVILFDESDMEMVVTGDYQREESQVFYTKNGDGDPGCPAEFYIEKIEIEGEDVTDSFNDEELDNIADEALQVVIENENEKDDFDCEVENDNY